MDKAQVVERNRKVESDWLASIGAPVKMLPQHVAEAVATRMFLEGLPAEWSDESVDTCYNAASARVVQT